MKPGHIFFTYDFVMTFHLWTFVISESLWWVRMQWASTKDNFSLRGSSAHRLLICVRAYYRLHTVGIFSYGTGALHFLYCFRTTQKASWKKSAWIFQDHKERLSYFTDSHKPLFRDQMCPENYILSHFIDSFIFLGELQMLFIIMWEQPLANSYFIMCYWRVW